MHPLNLKVMTWSWSLFGGATFVACVVYGLIVPAAFHATKVAPPNRLHDHVMTFRLSGCMASPPPSRCHFGAPIMSDMRFCISAMCSIIFDISGMPMGPIVPPITVPICFIRSPICFIRSCDI